MLTLPIDALDLESPEARFPPYPIQSDRAITIHGFHAYATPLPSLVDIETSNSDPNNSTRSSSSSSSTSPVTESHSHTVHQQTVVVTPPNEVTATPTQPPTTAPTTTTAPTASFLVEEVFRTALDAVRPSSTKNQQALHRVKAVPSPPTSNPIENAVQIAKETIMSTQRFLVDIMKR